MRKPAFRLPAPFLLRAAAHLSPTSSQAQSIAGQGTVTRLTCTAFGWFCHCLCLLATPWLHFRADNTPLWHIRLALQAILSCWSLLPCILDLCQFIPRLNCQTCSFSATAPPSATSIQAVPGGMYTCVYGTHMWYTGRGCCSAPLTCHCSSALLCVCGDQLFITQPNVAPSAIFPFNLFLVQPFPSQVSL